MSPLDSVESLQQLMADGGEKAFDLVPMTLKNVITERQWADHKDAKGNLFQSFESFVTHRLWQGLESTIDDLKAYCRKRPDVAELIDRAVEPLAGHGGDHKSKDQVDIINLKTAGGTSATYALKRLKRDRPELAEKVMAGDMSANAAAIEAGFREKPTPLKRLQWAWNAASKEEREEFLRGIGR